MRSALFKVVFSLALLVAWPLLGNGSKAQAGPISSIEDLDGSAVAPLIDAQPSRNESSSDVGLASPSLQPTDYDKLPDAPADLTRLAQLRQFLVDVGLQSLRTTGAAGGTGTGSVNTQGGRQDSLLSRPEVPRAHLVIFLFLDNLVHLPTPFLSTLFRPPRVAS
ncbi:MAG TPA: hypothetical protein VG013_32555 [Gemmataceae bacterium]|nr:hypothetical protein [Gemmataceae bacterium]